MCTLPSTRFVLQPAVSLAVHLLTFHLDFSQAEAQFEKIMKLDPYRVDDIDVYSNILYVTDNRLKLSRLAHEFLALDKDRPEVCCLVGTLFMPVATLPRGAGLDILCSQVTTILSGLSTKRQSDISDEPHSSIGLICLPGPSWVTNMSK